MSGRTVAGEGGPEDRDDSDEDQRRDSDALEAGSPEASNSREREDAPEESGQDTESARIAPPNQPPLPGLPFAWRDAHQSIIDYAYDRIADIARRRLAKEKGFISFQPTELVNEAWLKLHANQTPIRDKDHFIALAALAIRQVLIDYIRRRQTQKHGGHVDRIDVTVSGLPGAIREDRDIDLLDLDEAMRELELINAERARAVELRVFGSMELRSIATAMQVSLHKVQRMVDSGLAWLKVRLGDAVD